MMKKTMYRAVSIVKDTKQEQDRYNLPAHHKALNVDSAVLRIQKFPNMHKKNVTV